MLQIETDITNSVPVSAENNVIYVPPNIIPSVPIHFAIDNTDFSNNTPDGKNEFHSTDQIVFKKQQAFENETQLVIERSGEQNLKFKKEIAKIKTCFKPNPPNENFPNFSGIVHCDDLNLYKKYDQTWMVSSLADDIVPTWAAYNSLITDPAL